MTILCAGSIALDTTRTPFKTVENVLGGAAAYFAYSASFFSPVSVVSIVGKDFPKEYWQLLENNKNIDLSGVQRAGGKTFHYDCSFDYGLYTRTANKTELNVLADFQPKVPASAADAEYVYLATLDPKKQADVVKQAKAPKVVFMDTIEYYIENHRAELEKTMALCNGVVLNDAEARMLTGIPNLLKAGRKIAGMGPEAVVLKKGEHGCILFFQDAAYPFPAFPLEDVVDPNGAGDAFAGGLVGYLAREKATKLTAPALRNAIAYGTVMGSFAVEDFSLDKLASITNKDINARLEHYKALLRL